MRNFRKSLLLLAALLYGCGSGGGAPFVPNPDNLPGTWTGTWRLMNLAANPDVELDAGTGTAVIARGAHSNPTYSLTLTSPATGVTKIELDANSDFWTVQPPGQQPYTYIQGERQEGWSASYSASIPEVAVYVTIGGGTRKYTFIAKQKQ